MKRTLHIVTILLFTALSPFLSIADEKDKQSTEQEILQQKEQYEKTMEKRLGDLGRQLDDLKAKAAAMAKEAQKEIKQHIAEAEKKRKVASRELETMRKKSTKEWKKFSSNVDKSLDEFEKAYEKAKAHFKE